MQRDELMVPMRDGVKLATSVITNALPHEEAKKQPVILMRTPYDKKHSLNEPAAMFVAGGYNVVLQDVRGRYESEGKYDPFVDDMEDGYDTVEWVAQQEWCNGRVGMFGVSAVGIACLEAAMAQSPHLFAAVVCVARNPASAPSRFPGGLYEKSLNEDYLKMQGLPVDGVRPPRTPQFSEQDEKLDIQNYYSKINVPILNIGGWYDIHTQFMIKNFIGLQENGGSQVKGLQKLVMGPFGHIPLGGAIEIPDDATMNAVQELYAVRWFDHWLKEIDTGLMQEPPVRYYVMGDTFDKTAPGKEWRTCPSWPPASSAIAYYLHEDGSLSTDMPQAAAAQRSYTYNPADPIQTIGGNNLFLISGPMDQRPVSHRSDVLRFETTPLSEPLEVTGDVRVDLFVSTDAADTDFIIKLVDIYPNGFEALIQDKGCRLRFRNGIETQERVEKDRIYPITIDLSSTSLVFNKGHRIGVFVQSSNAPRFEPHPNTWESVRPDDAPVKATNTVHLNAFHPSCIVLPCVQGQE